MREIFFKAIILINALAVFNVEHLLAQCFSCKQAPPGTIFCDDFEDTISLSKKYFEYVSDGGRFMRVHGVGRDGGGGMRAVFQQGNISAGNLKKSFGRTPSTYVGNNAAGVGKDYNEIYWRVDVRLQPGWIGGGGDKLTRITAFANSNWAQGAIGHLWSGSATNANYLVMDPASGIDVNGNLLSTAYNDFPNLRWLGSSRSTIDMFSTANSGRWFCVEGHLKLNTPGLSDGVFEFWINDTLQGSKNNLNWHGNWNADTAKYQLNVIMLENYWNSGSPVTQERYLDNFIISTKRIGCCKGPVTGVGQSAPAASGGVIVYPNPSAGEISFQIANTDITSYSIIIVNTIGQVAYKKDRITTEVKISSGELKAGIYHYELSAQNSKAHYAGKLVIF